MRPHARPVAILVFALALAGAAGAARGEVASDFQQWAVANVEAKLDRWQPGLRLFLNAESRWLNAPRRDAEATGTGREEQNPNHVIILRPIVGYELAPWLTLWEGYAWQPVFYRNGFRENVMEHRVFEQATGSWKLGAWQLAYRTRLEHRIRTTGDDANARQGEGEWAHRFRQQARVSWTPVAGAPWQLILSDEILVHLNRTHYPTRQGLDQNRAFAGIGWHASEALRLEIGYLHQFVRRFTDRHQSNHVLSMSANWKGELP